MSKFKLIRECPACHKKLYLGDILKPAFQSTGKEIVCPKCGTTISEPWRKYSWLPFVGLGLGLLIQGWVPLLIILALSVLLMYEFVPLKVIKE
jgi:hypothetical protein